MDIALLHYPVYNKEGKVVTTAVTNLDIHDIARTARTYGVHGFYIVTPIRKQREMVMSILDHWRKGYGASYNPSRKEAFESVEVRKSLEEVIGEISAREGGRARVVVTGAALEGRVIPFADLSARLRNEGNPYLIVFGTGWGIAEEVIGKADFLLEPIRGPVLYNHLPVRAAVAVTLDRLVGLR